MLVTQSQAKKAIRKATGLSRTACYELVKRMDKVADGDHRKKVYSSDIEAAIRAYEKPPQHGRRTVRPLSPQMAARLAVSGK